MPSKTTSQLRASLQALDDQINGLVREFDEEDLFMRTFSVKEEEITSESVSKLEAIQRQLKANFDGFEIAETTEDTVRLKEQLRQLKEKEKKLSMERSRLVVQNQQSGEEVQRLQVKPMTV